MSNAKKLLLPKILMGNPKPTAVDKKLKSKFNKLKALRKQIAQFKKTYQEHDALMEELMPLFITVSNKTIKIKREVTVGNTTVKFSPYFYDEKKGSLVSKVWKSTPFPSASIES